MAKAVLTSPLNRRFCTAPMMRYSHNEARYLWHLLCPSALLYTEMIMAEAVIAGRCRAVATTPAPVALQLGGNNPQRLALAAKIGEEMGFSEINLNCGCPSPRVKSGSFGAVLMHSPTLVGEMVATIKNQVHIPVTVKCRIAVDNMDEVTGLNDFTQAVAAANVDALIVHARKAWLQGLNPAQNRTVPPINYPRVTALQQTFPTLPIILNGNLTAVQDIAFYAEQFSGVMVGRAICRQPYLLADIAAALFRHSPLSRQQALMQYLDYLCGQPSAQWQRALTTAIGLFYGLSHKKFYARQLSQLRLNSLADLNRLQHNLQHDERWAN